MGLPRPVLALEPSRDRHRDLRPVHQKQYRTPADCEEPASDTFCR
jgi:hypothetical protein